MTSTLAKETLETALLSQKKRPKGLILHSDQALSLRPMISQNIV